MQLQFASKRLRNGYGITNSESGLEFGRRNHLPLSVPLSCRNQLALWDKNRIVESLIQAIDGVVAQLVERLVRNEEVRGSIPLGSTINLLFRACFPVVSCENVLGTTCSGNDVSGATLFP